jgi:hypothetical protein
VFHALAITVTRALIAALAAITLAGCGGGSDGYAMEAAAAVGDPCGQSHSVSTRPSRVVWVVMENKGYSQIIGSSDAPYINRLARSCGLATQFTAEAHPSLPNYIAMTSGSTHGVTDDAGPSEHQLSGSSVFSQVGGSWRALMDSMPRRCSRADSGRYAVRHNPPLYYAGLQAQCAARDVPLTNPPDLSARFTFVAPDLCHDMHDCSVGTGDRWLAQWVPRILRRPEYRSGSLALFITWDEDDGSDNQHIPTLVVSSRTRRGTRSATPFNHYSLLRTAEEILGVPDLLGSAAQATSMRRAFNLG